MHDLISRQAAIDVLEKIPVREFKKTDDGLLDALIPIGQVYRALKQLPSAQPERKTGQWIIHSDDLFPAESTMECSVCHHEQHLIIDDEYCPHCGARMEVADD